MMRMIRKFSVVPASWRPWVVREKIHTERERVRLRIDFEFG